MDLANTIAATLGAGGGRPAPAGPEALERGATVGRFVLLGTLGAGGMGVVHAAYDPELDRKVALKLLLPRADGTSGAEGPTRLVREAQALVRLSHPNVVAVHDVGTHGERVWIAMEFVAGQTLTAWAAARPRPWSEVLPVLADVARGVSAAHAAGLVHRDLKPDNVMIGGDGRVRVMDFGLAHGRSPTSEPALASTLVAGSDAAQRLASRLTAVGAVQGTPAYMAPEQWEGREAEPATDQFGWSVMAWELLYGARPFVGETMVTLAAAVLSGQRSAPPRGHRVPGWLRRVIERGLAVEPARRWPTMAALLAALERGKTRARIRTAVVVLAGVALFGAGAAGYRRWDIARRENICTEAGAEIDRAWHEDARQRLRAAFVATGVSYAATTADKVMPWLDERAGAWKRARTEVCQNADVRALWGAELLDRALWCLEDRQMELTSLVDELGRANATTVQKAVTAVARLRAVDACLDEGQLQRQPAPPAQGREVIREVRVLLSRAQSLALAGDFTAGLKVTTRARERASAMHDWPPLVAAARAQEGNLLEKTGAYDAAEVASAEGYFEAARIGAWEVAAGAAVNLIYTVGYQRARHAEGRAWAQHAEVALTHAGDREGVTAAGRLNNLALVHYAAGAYTEARALHERALAIKEQTLGPDHPEVAASLNNLAAVHHLAGAYAEARALYERALAIRERALGPDHPEVATTLNNLAILDETTGAYADARTLQERALAIRERSLGPDHPDVALGLNNLASLLENTGAYAEARALHERALAIRERVLGPDHPEVAASLNNLAVVHHVTGAYAEARALYERALAIRERALGPDHPEVATTLHNLGVVEFETGAYVLARTLHERALAIREQRLGPDHPDVAASLNSLASVYVKTGAYAEARARNERALAIWEKTVGPDHPKVATSLNNLASVYVKTGAYAEARALSERALAIAEKALGPDHPDVALGLNNLASVHLAEKRPEEALPLLERAMIIYRAHDGVQTGEMDAQSNLARARVAI